MIAAFKDGELWWRNVWRDREGMIRQAIEFETGKYPNPELARQCRQAVAEHDAYYAEEEDDVQSRTDQAA